MATAHDARFLELIRLAATVFLDPLPEEGTPPPGTWLRGELAQTLGGNGSLEMKIKNPGLAEGISPSQ